MGDSDIHHRLSSGGDASPAHEPRAPSRIGGTGWEPWISSDITTLGLILLMKHGTFTCRIRILVLAVEVLQYRISRDEAEGSVMCTS